MMALGNVSAVSVAMSLTVCTVTRAAAVVSCMALDVPPIIPSSFKSLAVSRISLAVSHAATVASYTACVSSLIAPL
jgi:hypothetical protein